MQLKSKDPHLWRWVAPICLKLVCQIVLSLPQSTCVKGGETYEVLVDPKYDHNHKSMDAEACVEALKEALAKYARLEIFNTDQGSPLTSAIGSTC